MYEEALGRLVDAETLAGAMTLSEQSNSPYLLRLLGLELLLKLIYEITLRKPGKGHDYAKLFDELPGNLQKRVLALAGERLGPSVLCLKHTRVLQEWGMNFVALRYPWDRYPDVSEEEFARIGMQWSDEGAPLDEAVFRYFPEELFGFLLPCKLWRTS